MTMVAKDEIEEKAMSSESAPSSHEILESARKSALDRVSQFTGSLNPVDAWTLFQRGDAVLVDVRTAEEIKFVGHVKGSRHVAWQTGPALIRNPRFLKELEQKTSKDDIILLLCRSGKRSAAAAEAAAKAGFRNVFNILEGFEGDKNDQDRRGEEGGWRHRGLPWVQD